MEREKIASIDGENADRAVLFGGRDLLDGGSLGILGERDRFLALLAAL